VELRVIDGIDDFYGEPPSAFLQLSRPEDRVSPTVQPRPFTMLLLHGGHLDEQPLTVVLPPCVVPSQAHARASVLCQKGAASINKCANQTCRPVMGSSHGPCSSE